MATYITLVKYTQKGIETIKQAPDRINAAKQRIRAAGGEMKAFYLTMGRYDAVVITEARTDEAAAANLLAAGAQGTIHTETLRAFTEDEFRKIIAAMP
ncbi:MAG TPA: GYD domain-containing protein [bacterium]|nr:GYD domain-containing protein [bacterium]